MDKVTVKFSVFFEDPFWVGILERISEGRLSACKVTFGAEPKDYEVNEFLSKNYYRLRLSPAVEAKVKEAHKNPKRMLREVQKAVKDLSLGTKSQQALKLQHEQAKENRRVNARDAKEEEKNRRFELKQQKRKEKHRGR